VIPRAEFERRRLSARSAERRAGIPLVLASVGLGFAQLIFLRWADSHLSRETKTKIAVPLFFAYLALVAWLLWRFQRGRRAAQPRCPSCGSILEELSQRVAAATGRCDACGTQILEDPRA
jgi:hypothetical protein